MNNLFPKVFVCISFICLLSVLACNTYDIDFSQYNGEWSLPLINGSIDAHTLVKNATKDAEIQVANDGLITLRYKGQDLIKTKKDVFSPIPIGIPIPMIDTATNVALPSVNNIVVHKAILTNGNYSFSYSHNRPENIKLSLWVPEMKINTATLRHDVDIAYSGGSVTTGASQKFSMNDVVLTPVNNRITLRYIGANTKQERFKLGSLFFLIDQLDFKFIQGIIGQSVFDLKKDSIKLDIYSGASSAQELLVFDPRLLLTVENSFGFPSKAVIKEFFFQTPGGMVSFKSKLLDAGLEFDYPLLSQQGNSKTTTFIFDKTNSNINEVVNAQATRVIYDIDALANPQNIQDTSYYVREDSRIKVSSVVEIPLRLKLSDYKAEKTFDINTEKLAELKAGKLLIETKNNIPLAGQSQIYLLTESGSIIDSLFSSRQSIIAVPAVDAMGNATTPAIQLITIPLPENKISKWSTAKKIKTTTWFQSPTNRPFVNFAAQNKMDIRMAFVGQLNF